MDICDLFSTGATGAPGGPRRGASAEEHVAWALGLLLFPLLAFLIVILGRGWIWDHAEFVLMGLPAVFSLIACLVARRLGAGMDVALRIMMGCGFACFLSAGAAGLIVAMVSFLETF